MILFLDILLFAAVFLGVVAWGMSRQQQKVVADRIGSLAVEGPSSRKQAVLRQMSREGSFNDRILFPLARKMYATLKSYIPTSSESWVRQKMIQAGHYEAGAPALFLGCQLVFVTVLAGGYLLLSLLAGNGITVSNLFYGGLLGAVGVLMPLIWLSSKATNRQKEIQKSLPDFLDLLVICVESGLGLDVAIHKISKLDTTKTSNYLRDELVRYINDINFGKSRREALLDLAKRTGVEDISIIVNALVQAYEMGSGVAHTLRVQSETFRSKRMQRAEERANKIPVKMVMPIYIFMFPMIFLVIFGPMGMSLMKNLMKIFSSTSGMN